MGSGWLSWRGVAPAAEPRFEYILVRKRLRVELCVVAYARQVAVEGTLAQVRRGRLADEVERCVEACHGTLVITRPIREACPATVRWSLLPTSYFLLPTYYSLLTTHYLLLTTHCSLLTTHYSLLTTGPGPGPGPQPQPQPQPQA